MCQAICPAVVDEPVLELAASEGVRMSGAAAAARAPWSLVQVRLSLGVFEHFKQIIGCPFSKFSLGGLIFVRYNHFI